MLHILWKCKKREKEDSLFLQKFSCSEIPTPDCLCAISVLRVEEYQQCVMKRRTGNPKKQGSGRRRARHDIIFGILEAAKNGELKTHIMGKVKLSSELFERYISFLLSKNFVRREGRFYRTTEKGLTVIEACKLCLELVE